MKYRVMASQGWQKIVVEAQLRFNINWESEDAPNILPIAPLDQHVALRSELSKLRTWFRDQFGPCALFVLVDIRTPFPPKKVEEPEPEPEARCKQCGAFPLDVEGESLCAWCLVAANLYKFASRGERSHLTRTLNVRRRHYGWVEEATV